MARQSGPPPAMAQHLLLSLSDLVDVILLEKCFRMDSIEQALR